MAAAGGIGEIVYAVALEYERGLEDILQLGIGNKAFLTEEGVCRYRERPVLVPPAGIPFNAGRQGVDIKLSILELRHSTAEAVENTPGGKIKVLALVVILEKHRVEGDDIMYVSVGYHHGIVLAKYVLPRSYRRVALSDIDIARLAIVIAVFAVWLPHYVGCPHHFCCRPVHDVVPPIDEVLAHPHLGRAVAVARAVGCGIYIICVTELPYRGVSEIARNEGVEVCGSIPFRACDRRMAVFLSRWVLSCG